MRSHCWGYLGTEFVAEPCRAIRGESILSPRLSFAGPREADGDPSSQSKLAEPRPRTRRRFAGSYSSGRRPESGAFASATLILWRTLTFSTRHFHCPNRLVSMTFAGLALAACNPASNSMRVCGSTGVSMWWLNPAWSVCCRSDGPRSDDQFIPSASGRTRQRVKRAVQFFWQSRKVTYQMLFVRQIRDRVRVKMPTEEQTCQAAQ